MEKIFPIVVKTMQSLEPLLAKEMIALGATDVEEGRRVVRANCDLETLYKINYRARLALRVLCPLNSFQIRKADDLYNKAYEMPWEEYLQADTTFAIDPQVSSSMFTHSHFPSLRVKDAIADRLKKVYGSRPDVNPESPDVQIHLLIDQEKVQISLDSSGRSLNQRGYRVNGGEAPMNEVLAAGIIAITGWKGETPLYNPFCGSGTIAFEAAYAALNIPAQKAYPKFNFQTWLNFDDALWMTVHGDANALIENKELTIVASDIDYDQLNVARKNGKNLPFNDAIRFEKSDFFSEDSVPEVPGIVVLNPPYGERMEIEELEKIYSEIGSVFKHRYSGSTAWIISSDLQALHAIGLRQKRKVRMMNGKLECELRGIDLFRGKRNERFEIKPIDSENSSPDSHTSEA